MYLVIMFMYVLCVCLLLVIHLHRDRVLLSTHGVLLPPNMYGLTNDQIVHLKSNLIWGVRFGEYAETCTPSGRFLKTPDPVEHRNRKGRTVHLLPFEVL